LRKDGVKANTASATAWAIPESTIWNPASADKTAFNMEGRSRSSPVLPMET
jgi:hypothetical protein